MFGYNQSSRILSSNEKDYKLLDISTDQMFDWITFRLVPKKAFDDWKKLTTYVMIKKSVENVLNQK